MSVLGYGDSGLCRIVASVFLESDDNSEPESLRRLKEADLTRARIVLADDREEMRNRVSSLLQAAIYPFDGNPNWNMETAMADEAIHYIKQL